MLKEISRNPQDNMRFICERQIQMATKRYACGAVYGVFCSQGSFQQPKPRSFSNDFAPSDDIAHGQPRNQLIFQVNIITSN